MDKDTSPKNEATDVPAEAIADMTVDDKGTMQDITVSTEPAEGTPSAPEPMMDVTPPPQDEVIQAPEPASEEEATPQDGPSPAEAPTQQVVTPTGVDSTSPATDLPKKSGKGLIVAIAVVLALVLAAIAVLVYMKASTSTKSADKSSTDTSAKVETPKVTATDIDTTTKDVDDTLNSLNDTQDFASDVISDKALGLQ